MILLAVAAPNVTEAKLLLHGIISIRFIVDIDDSMTNIQIFTGMVLMQYRDTTILYRYTVHPRT